MEYECKAITILKIKRLRELLIGGKFASDELSQGFQLISGLYPEALKVMLLIRSYESDRIWILHIRFRVVIPNACYSREESAPTPIASANCSARTGGCTQLRIHATTWNIRTVT